MTKHYLARIVVHFTAEVQARLGDEVDVPEELL